ncbi:MAG: SPASM domain-containing protein [Deltaproteobacteria bacterium]|nr:SPASM domain-containing protein [Deltaproteobacteria bacterium]
MLLNKKITTPCHLRQLFINHDGDIFPCCRKWGDQKSKIGNIDELDIYNKIATYDYQCECDGYKLTKAGIGTLHFETINIEFSLACNGKCAMCCVHAPDSDGKYSHYETLRKFIDITKPNKLSVQGGEVLYQKKTLKWLWDVKNKNPDMKFHVISNGCFNNDILLLAEYLFETMTISIVGFEDHTYKTIMGLELRKTKAFAEELLSRKKIKLSLKYLCTPLNLHQSALFYEWAVLISPNSIQIVDANINSYIRLDTFDSYWNKIFERAGSDLKAKMILYNKMVSDKDIKISLCKGIRNLLDISDNYISANSLANINFWY